MITITPVGTSSISASSLPILVRIKEKLCKAINTESNYQPRAKVEYITGNPILSETTVFIPVTIIMTIVTLGSNHCVAPQVYTENFTAAFQEQSSIPNTITVESRGKVEGLSDVRCCRASSYNYEDSIVITIATN